MNKKLFFLVISIFSTIILAFYFLFNSTIFDNTNYNYVNVNGVNIKGDKTKYKVNFVEKIDGDTIVVNFNGRNMKVRYLLIDTPETVKPNTKVEPYGPEASNFNGNILKNAKTVEIEFDIYAKEDKYHRALCYVYADGKSVQEQLLEQGLAEIKYVHEPDTRYLKKFAKAQNKAKSNKRNIWSNSDCEC